MTREVAFGTIEKHPDAVRLVSLEWFDLVASFWESERQYAVSDIVRPSQATGFAYQAGGAGQTARHEPRWPRTLGGTVVDGAITWTAIAAGANGVTAVTAPAVTLDPSGELTAGAPSVIDGEGADTRVQFTLSGGTDGSDYYVEVEVTAGSETLLGTFLVEVKLK